MLSSLKIGTRLGISFAILVALTIALGVIALNRVGEINGGWQNFETVTLQKRIAATNGYVNLGQGIQSFKNYVLRGGKYADEFNGFMNEIDASVATYRAAGSVTAEEEALLVDILRNSKVYRDATAQAVELKTAGTEIAQIDKSIKGADRPLAAAFAKLLELNDQKTASESARFSELMVSAQW